MTNMGKRNVEFYVRIIAVHCNTYFRQMRFVAQGDTERGNNSSSI